MHTFVRLPLPTAIALVFLTGCGGSFSNPNLITEGHSQLISTPTPAPTPAIPPPTAQTPKTVLNTPTLGSAMPIPKRNQEYNFEKNEYAQEHLPLDQNQIIALASNGLDSLKKELGQKYQGKDIKQSTDNYQFVKAGWVFSELYNYEQKKFEQDGKKYILENGDGYLYYYGDKPTTGLLKGKANYTGHWDFVTDAKRVRDKQDTGTGLQQYGGGSSYHMDDRFGNDIGATSFAENLVSGQVAPRQGNHIATFEADFDTKTLNGKLSVKQKENKDDNETYAERYAVNANITGNRFVGSATTQNAGTQFNLFSKNATNRLEGGFFGDNGEELAGKFLTDDDSLFGVFAGKQAKAQSLAKKYDGLYVESTQDSDVNPLQKAQVLNIANFGDVNTLVVNGKTIELVPLTAKQIATHKDSLPTGQNLSITSFGTADGALRLGAVNKTALVADPEAQKQAIAKAKEQLLAKKESQVKKVDELVTQYTDAVDNEEEKTVIQKLKAQIIAEALVGYSEGENKTNIKAQIEKNLTALAKNTEKYELGEQVTELAGKGDIFDVSQDKNWQAFLPKVEPKLIGIDDSLTGLFLLGERTAVDKMPKAGTAKYQGTWHGRIGSHFQSEAGYGDYDGKSQFVVDFAQKSLTGSLTEKSGIKPAFDISAVIKDNGFTGTATSRADGINLDKGQQQNQQILSSTTTNNLVGGFYGDKAEHLGGAFSFDGKLQGTDKQVVGGAVFYGTKQGE